MNIVNRSTLGLAVLAMSLVSGSALADPVAIDTADAVAQVGAAGTAIAAVGGSILILAAISLAYRWVKATFF